MASKLDSMPVEIDCHSVQAKLQNDKNSIFLLDCREPAEHELANLPEAHLLPMSELSLRIEELQPHREREIIVLCHLGMRSRDVTHWLREQGFKKVKSMTGGIDQWSQQIDPSVPRY